MPRARLYVYLQILRRRELRQSSRFQYAGAETCAEHEVILPIDDLHAPKVSLVPWVALEKAGGLPLPGQ
jgi:hypothetical protein